MGDELSTLEMQRRVRGVVEARGYFRGWSGRQLALRQAAKLVEETAELGQAVQGYLPPALWSLLEGAGSMARWHFERGYWVDVNFDADTLRTMVRELADVQVVVWCLAEVLGELLGEQVDIGGVAAAKAEADVERGVRGG